MIRLIENLQRQGESVFVAVASHIKSQNSVIPECHAVEIIVGHQQKGLQCMSALSETSSKIPWSTHLPVTLLVPQYLTRLCCLVVEVKSRLLVCDSDNVGEPDRSAVPPVILPNDSTGQFVGRSVKDGVWVAEDKVVGIEIENLLKSGEQYGEDLKLITASKEGHVPC